MIIIGNQYTKESRDFIATNPGNIVLDWYNDADRSEYIRISGFSFMSAFPTVILHMPPYFGDDTNTEKFHHAGTHHLISMPEDADMSKVTARIAAINQRATGLGWLKPDEVTPLEAISIADVHRSDAYWRSQLAQG